MIHFTHNNHLKYFINDKLYAERNSIFDRYKVEVGKVDKQHFNTTTFNKELIRIAELVFTELGKDFVIYFSGGTDSEIVVRSFLQLNLKPKLVMIKYNNNYNLEDIKYADKLAKQLDLKLEFYDFHLENFMASGEADSIAKDVQCSQIVFCALYYVINKLGLPAVMGGSMPFLKNVRNTPSNWYYCYRENEEGSAIRFSLKYKIPLIYEWFSYTPEIMALYLQHKLTSHVLYNQNYKLTFEYYKNEILCDLVPGLELRQKKTGFEKIVPMNIEYYKILNKEFPSNLTGDLDGIEVLNLKKMLDYET